MNMLLPTNFLVWLMFLSALCAETVFDGPIFFKGDIVQQKFQGKEFQIDAEKGRFVVVCGQTGKVFTIPTKAKLVRDAVISGRKSAVAVSFSYTSSNRDSRRCLVTVTGDGVVRPIDYAGNKITEDLGWIIELGAVSNDGLVVLAKFAKFLPKGNGMNYVNHEWAFVSLEKGKIELIEEVSFESAITRWPDLGGGQKGAE